MIATNVTHPLTSPAVPGRAPRRTRLVAALAVGLAVAGATIPAAADELDSKKAEAARIADRLDELEVTASALDENYNQVAAELATLDVEVAQAEANVAQYETELTAVREKASGFALKAYMSADSGLGGLLGGSAAGNEAAQKDGYASIVLGLNTSVTDELQATTEDAQAAQADLAAKRESKAELEAQLTDRRSEVDAAIADYQEMKATVQGELAELVAQEQARREAAAAATPQMLQSPPAAPSGGASGDDADADADEDAPAASESAGDEGARPPDSAGSGGSGDSGDEDSSSGGGAGANVPPPSPGASGAVEAAMSQLGVPWKFAAASPGVAFDCSGLTMWAWGQAGVGLPHSSKLQYSSLPHVPADQARPGDLFFFGDPIHHVGMYIGNGQMVNSTQAGDFVKVGNAYRDDLVGVGRPG